METLDLIKKYEGDLKSAHGAWESEKKNSRHPLNCARISFQIGHCYLWKREMTLTRDNYRMGLKYVESFLSLDAVLQILDKSYWSSRKTYISTLFDALSLTTLIPVEFSLPFQKTLQENLKSKIVNASYSGQLRVDHHLLHQDQSDERRTYIYDWILKESRLLKESNPPRFYYIQAYWHLIHDQFEKFQNSCVNAFLTWLKTTTHVENPAPFLELVVLVRTGIDQGVVINLDALKTQPFSVQFELIKS